MSAPISSSSYYRDPASLSDFQTEGLLANFDRIERLVKNVLQKYKEDAEQADHVFMRARQLNVLQEEYPLFTANWDDFLNWKNLYKFFSKVLKPFSGAFFNIKKWSALREIKNQVAAIRQSHEYVRFLQIKEYAEHHARLDDAEKKIYEEQALSLNKSLFKGTQSIISLGPLLFFSQSAKIVSALGKFCLDLVEGVSTLKAVHKGVIQLNAWQEQCSENPQFDAIAAEKLNQYRIDFENHMKASLKVIDDLLAACTEMEFDALKKHLDENHLHLNQLQDAPNSKEEWETQVLDPQFKEDLRRQWVEYHETIGQLTKQALRSHIAHKVEVERRLLILNCACELLEFSLHCFQLYKLIFKPMDKVTDLLKEFCKDHANLKFGYFFLSILYPDYDFTIEDISLNTLKNIVYASLKPNSYGLEGYKLSAKEHQIFWQNHLILFKLQSETLYHQAAIQLANRIPIWIQLLLKETHHYSIPLHVINRRLQIESIGRKKDDLLQQSQKEMEEISLKRAALEMADAELPPKQRAKGDAAIPIIMEALASANGDYFYEDAQGFYKEHFGTLLKNESNQRKKMIEARLRQTGLAFCSSPAA